jgi:uncharacterized membrane protein
MAIERLSQASILTLNKYSSMMAGSVASDYELISTTLLASATPSVTFSNLSTVAAGYKHLQLRITERSTASINSQLGLRFNGDSSASYSEHQVRGNGSSLSSYGGGGVNFAPLAGSAESGATANAFGARIIDILNFSDTITNTVVRQFMGIASSASSVGLFSAAWHNTAAVTSIEVFMNTASLVQYSRISLYGLRG